VEQTENSSEDLSKKPYVDVTIKATEPETETKIFVKKDEKVNFVVLGGKWKMYPHLDQVDVEGHKNYLNEINFGAMYGKIGGDIFQIKNNTSFKCRTPGILFLFPNLNEITNAHPSGEINMRIYGGVKYEDLNHLDKLENEDMRKTFTIVESSDTKGKVIDVTSGQKVVFTVKGKWRFWKDHEFTDFNGYEGSNLENNLNVGALIGEIGKTSFVIRDNLEFTFKEAGKLRIYPNVGKTFVEPEGKMKVWMKNHHIKNFVVLVPNLIILVI